MKILKTQEYVSEKLDIKPMSKESLKKAADRAITESDGWKKKLQTLDCVSIQKDTKSGKFSEIYYYISNEDLITTYKDTPHFDKIANGLNTKEGVFVRFTLNQEDAYYMGVDLFCDDKMKGKNIIENRKLNPIILQIDRLEQQPQKGTPVHISFFKTYRDHNYKWKTIYKRAGLVGGLYPNKQL